jgi:hypothetical protein
VAAWRCKIDHESGCSIDEFTIDIPIDPRHPPGWSLREHYIVDDGRFLAPYHA